MKRLALALTIYGSACAAPALAAGKVPYGSRVGMEVTVRRVSGIGTAHAQIFVEHTRADAKAFCVQYSDDNSEKCVQDTLRDVHINDVLEGSCTTGRFVSLSGEKLRFAGEKKRHQEGEASYIIIGEDGQPLGGDSASGYPVDLGQFRALCPSRVLADY